MWNDTKNRRRCELIDKWIDGVATQDEISELERLQAEMLKERKRQFPLPIQQVKTVLDER